MAILFFILESNQILENIERNLNSVNPVSNEEVLLQSTITEVQCAVLTDVLENQIPESTSKYSIFIKACHGDFCLIFKAYQQFLESLVLFLDLVCSNHSTESISFDVSKLEPAWHS